MGMIYTPDLARYAAMAAISLPESALGEAVDVGWNQPVSGDDLAAAFSKVPREEAGCKAGLSGFCGDCGIACCRFIQYKR